MNFKKPKITCETEHVFDDENNNIQNSKSSFNMFTKQEDLLSFVENSALKPQFHLKNSIIFRSVHANINVEMPTSLLNHSEHTGGKSCQTCVEFYEKYLCLEKQQMNFLEACTVEQGNSKLWHDSRRIRITGSSTSPYSGNYNP